LCQSTDNETSFYYHHAAFFKIKQGKPKEIMKRIIATICMLIAVGMAYATLQKDTVPAAVPALVQDDPEMKEIDRILVSSYLHHFCYSTDKELLNAYGYAPEMVPTFTADIMEARMKALDKETPFDLVYNSTVQGFIDLYAVRRRDITTKVLGMSQLYFPMFEEMLAKYNIPMEMKYLAIVESALNPVAISSAGAGGLWQFMVGTGKMYGLDVNSYQDERFDAYKATEAACKYLKFLYDTFGDWQLALAAYNSGPGNVNKAIRRSGGKKDFWAIKSFLPKETQGYVPAFIAVNYVMSFAPEHNIYPKKPLTTFFETDTVGVKSRVDFAATAKLLDMPYEDLCFLNGTYKLKEIPGNGHKHYMVLPVNKVGLFISNEETIYAESQVNRHEPEPVLTASVETSGSNENTTSKVVYEEQWLTHKVRKGESLGSIASKYDVSLAQLKKWNKIKGSKIANGQKLKVQARVKKTIQVPADAKKPIEEQVAESKSESVKKETTTPTEQPKVEQPATATTTKKKEESEPQYKYYTVQPGDTLWKIANNKGTSIEKIKQLNKGLRENKLTVGQKLKIKQI
jgi:membrane-bound lytic murein transglycosylase D